MPEFKINKRVLSVFASKPVFFFLVVLFLFANQLLAQEATLKVAYDQWPPWKMTTGDKIGGIDAEILREIGKRSDLKFEFIVAPWKRCIEMLKNGDVDLITSFAENENRKEFTSYIQPHYFIGRVRLYGLNSRDLQINEYDDLYNYRIGAVKGAHYNDQFDRDERMHKEMVVHEKQLIRMLIAGRIDLLIDWEIPFDYIVNEMNKQDLIKKYKFKFSLSGNEKDNILEHASFLAFSKKSEKLKYKDQIEAILQSMVEKGEIIDLINRFMEKIREVKQNNNNSLLSYY